jgi:hypothetical protein
VSAPSGQLNSAILENAMVASSDLSGLLAMRLAELFENARRVPLLRDRVRVDKREVYRLVESIQEAVRAEAGDSRLDSTAGSDLHRATTDVQEAVKDAYPVPFTDQVRLPSERVTELANALRAAARL